MTGTHKQKSLKPTRKWLVAQATAVGAWLVAAINAGWHITAALQIMAVGIVVAALATYWTPNVNEPGGVARRRSR
jgi:hypothetical protein